MRATGVISFCGRNHLVGRGLAGLDVAMRATTTPGHFMVVFCHHVVANLVLEEGESVSPEDLHTCHPIVRSKQAPSE